GWPAPSLVTLSSTPFVCDSSRSPLWSPSLPAGSGCVCLPLTHQRSFSTVLSHDSTRRNGRSVVGHYGSVLTLHATRVSLRDSLRGPHEPVAVSEDQSHHSHLAMLATRAINPRRSGTSTRS